MYIFYATGCENGEDPRRQKKGTLFMFALVTFMHEFLSPGRFSSLLVIISHYRQGCKNKLSGILSRLQEFCKNFARIVERKIFRIS